MKPAIIETVMSQLVAEGREVLAEGAASEKDLAWRRVLAGRFLLKARKQLPKRASNGDGWMALLEGLEIDSTTAERYIKLAEATLTLTERNKDKVPTYADLGLDKREGPKPPSDVPEPRDEDAPPERERAVERDDDGAVAESATPEPESEVEIDRDTWCTPPWIAEAIGDFDLDPCSNERSVIKAAREFRLEERAEDGLFFASKVDAEARVFINPPYSDVPPWIEAYAHTRFCFLLKLDTSTRWFDRLFGLSELILLPRLKRVQFVPPPGVPPEKAIAQQFPHALFYARASDATKAIRDICFSPWRTK